MTYLVHNSNQGFSLTALLQLQGNRLIGQIFLLYFHFTAPYNNSFKFAFGGTVAYAPAP